MPHLVPPWHPPADESEIKAEFTLILDVKILRHTYTTTMLDKPRTGEETIIYNTTGKNARPPGSTAST
ncbi:MAG: hypothetical protein VCB26_14690 [Candidatus Hydrogenedentota bacterium]